MTNNLSEYIQGKRYGKDAHQLEKEALSDPFLQDAIDGYDRVNDRPGEHLTKLEKQLSKRRRKKYRLLQWWGIAAAILLIICLSIFYFTTNRFNFSKDSSFIENHADSIISQYSDSTYLKSLVQKQFSDNATHINADTSGSNNLNSVAEKVKPADKPVSLLKEPVQPEEKKKPEDNQKKIQREDLSEPSSRYSLSDRETQALLNRKASQSDEDPNETLNETPTGYTLSNSETQALLSSYTPEKAAKATPSSLSPPHPTKGNKVYNDYIEKNRKSSTDVTCENQHGKVILVFHVNKQGRPTDIAILRSLCPSADREAVRLLQNGPDWTAGEPLARLEITF